MPPGDIWPTGIVQFAPRLVLIEAEMNESPYKMAGLRSTAADRPRDSSGQRVGGANVVLQLVLEKRCDIPERSKADPQHIRILGSEDHVVCQCGIEPVFHADLC